MGSTHSLRNAKTLRLGREASHEFPAARDVQSCKCCSNAPLSLLVGRFNAKGDGARGRHSTLWTERLMRKGQDGMGWDESHAALQHEPPPTSIRQRRDYDRVGQTRP